MNRVNVTGKPGIVMVIFTALLAFCCLPALAFAAPARSDASDGDALPAVRDVADDAAEQSLEPLNIVDGKNIYQVDLQQTTGTTMKVTLPNLDKLLSLNKADAVTITAVMSYQGNETRRVSATKPLAELQDTNNAFTMDCGDYGKFAVTAHFKKGDSDVATGDTQTLGIVADEYNICPVSASLPVAFFSLQLWGPEDIRHNAKGGIVPSILLFERPRAYNWDALPEGVYGLPYLTREQLTYQPATFSDASSLFQDHSQAMVEYVHDLYELNPEATFNLYCVDFYAGLIQSILYANQIPEDHYTITLMSDGSFSYSQFNAVYSSADPQATHKRLINQWNTAKRHAYDNGVVDRGYTLNQPNSLLYAAVDSEPNAQWWLARPALLESRNDKNAFGAAAQADSQVVRIYIDQQLKALQDQGDSAIAEFKALYNFNDSYFADAGQSGKSVMMFLGSSVSAEEGTFPSYARFTKAFYGDAYAYYYKGHPATPTDLHPEKAAELSALGITDVDSTVAAELILFFYPDIFMSGYPSSTYASVSNPAMAKGLFTMSKTAALAETNQDYSIMDWYMSPITLGTPQAIRTLATNDKTFLVEFSDEYLKDVDYTIALWDDEASEIRFYRQTANGYDLVSTTSGEGGGTAYVATIATALDPSKVIDVAGASPANNTNVQIYQANESFAQKFRFKPVDANYWMIENVGSGKVLDVENFAATDGANVQQYDGSESDAQLWSLAPTGDDDGSVYLVSKCNGLYLDVATGSSDNGTNVQVWTGNGSKAQKFLLNRMTPVIQNGVYELESALDTSKVLDIQAGSFDDAANVQLYGENQTDAQKFSVHWDADLGCYSIVNVGSGKALDVAGADSSSGANVWQYAPNKTCAQGWSLLPADNGAYRIVSATGGGCCLDVAGATTTDGTNVQIWADNGTAAQQWFFKAA